MNIYGDYYMIMERCDFSARLYLRQHKNFDSCKFMAPKRTRLLIVKVIKS